MHTHTRQYTHTNTHTHTHTHTHIYIYIYIYIYFPRIIRRDYDQATVKYIDKQHGVSATNLVLLVNSNGISVSSVPTNDTSTPNSVPTISTLDITHL